ncbi:dihydrolipoamide acetyltransferase family protein [Sphingobium aromaticivastans]|uniref:dihydrolipoamide acetyltransferase family protein n=1 Tax=Sphingobium aromaticivastans TaxID=1778665 RepID=UPI003015EBF1
MSILQDLNIPRSGSVENAKLLSWIVKEGGRFSEGDILYEIETDKVATEVEATQAGILVRQIAQEGDEHKVGDRVGLFARPGTSAADIDAALAAFDQGEAPAAPVSESASVTEVPTAASGGAGDRLSPIVRRLAKERGVDLAQLRGTGPGGRITAEDVEAAAGAGSSGALPGGYEVVAVERITLSTRRKTIARRLTEAAAAPTLTADMEIDLTALFARRKAADKAPSVLAMIAQAVSQLLASPEHRALNATLTSDEMLAWKTVNLGIAVDTDDGLVVPVIRDVQSLDVQQLTARIADLAERARDNRLSADELEGGTFTLSNPGSLGPVIRAEAILNVPQIALLGLPAIVWAPVVIADGDSHKVEIRRVVRPSLTFDHRAVDGGTVIRFLSALKEKLEAA